MISQRLVGFGLVLLSLGYLGLFVDRGWVPHDEGMIGQAAERVMTGGVPHVDYEEPYTGGLAWLHAAVFRVAGVELLHLRWLLFAGAVLSQLLIYSILSRYLGPIGAAVGAWIALGWSFPNYFAALPSWWVLVCALSCVWAFTRHVETGLLRYAAGAGLAAGVSILAKQTGLYVLIALLIALSYDGGRQERDTDAEWPGRILCAGLAIAAVGLAFMVLSSRLAIAELLYLLLPIAACSRLLITSRGGLRAPAIAVAAAALPVACFVVPYIADQQMGRLLDGLFVLPQKRLQFASLDMPPVHWIVAGIPLVAIVMPLPLLDRARGFVTRPVVGMLWLLGLTVPILSLYDMTSYQVIWQSVRAFAALLPVACCWLILSERVPDAKQRRILFGLASMLAWASLVQFPFSAAIYFCYVTPLVVTAAVAAAGNSAAIRRPVFRVAAALLLTFALVSMNPGYIFNLGWRHEAQALNVPLNLPRADLRVSAADAVTYRRVVELIESHIGTGRLVAGPDCPELYFLTGQFSPTGTLFDFFTADASGEGGLRHLPAWTTASVVVLNHRRTFSPGLSSDLGASVRKMFPESEAAGPFEVRWR